MNNLSDKYWEVKSFGNELIKLFIFSIQMKLQFSIKL